MSRLIPPPFNDAMVQAAIAEWDWPAHYYEDRYYWPPDRTRRYQNARLLREVARASGVPFYRRLWERAGFDPGRFRGIDDLHQLPLYTIEDIRESIAIAPPYGDYQGAYPSPSSTSLRMYFSGGTTGKPRPTVYTPWDRMVSSLIGSRRRYREGARPGHVVLNAWAYSTHNGAWAVDEGSWYFAGAIPITSSTGNMTSTIEQVRLAVEYQVVSISTTSDYLLHLRKVADELGYQRSDFNIQYLGAIGNRAAVEQAWGVRTSEAYAFHEVNSVAGECEFHNGMHVAEDAFILEIVDPESGEPLPDGETGDIVVTCLYKTGSPQIRFNIKDLAAIVPGTCPCGSHTKRITSLKGRSDTMVKVRGINIWPEAIGAVMQDAVGHPVEYFCVAHMSRGQDDMSVVIETDAPGVGRRTDLTQRLENVIKDRLGLRLSVREAGPGELDSLTGKGEAAKLRRYKDERRQTGVPDNIARLIGISTQENA